MAFTAPFARVILPPLGPGLSSLNAWWLSGGIAAANCIAAYQAKGAASQASSYVNLANPGTYDAAPGSAPTWDISTGWTFNGTSQYLVTGVVPDDVGTMIVRFANADTSGNKVVCGSMSTFPNGMFLQNSNGTVRVYVNGSFRTVSGLLTSGVMVIAGKQGYLNGSADGAALPAGTYSITRDIYIGALNSNGSVSGYRACDVLAFAYYNIELTSTVVGTLSTAIAAL